MKYKVTTATEALQVFDMLGIKNVSTRRQKKNGTQVSKIPLLTPGLHTSRATLVY